MSSSFSLLEKVDEIQILLPARIQIEESQLKKFELVWNELRAWHDVDKDKSNKDLYLSLTLWYLQCKNLQGELIQTINKHVTALVKENNTAVNKKAAELRYQVLERCFGNNGDWKHVLQQLKLQLLIDFPSDYRSF